VCGTVHDTEGPARRQSHLLLLELAGERIVGLTSPTEQDVGYLSQARPLAYQIRSDVADLQRRIKHDFGLTSADARAA
jgi:hypothetical protein